MAKIQMAVLLVILKNTLQLLLETLLPSFEDIALKIFLCEHQRGLPTTSVEQQAKRSIIGRLPFHSIDFAVVVLLDVRADVLLNC
jgi:hypothetical protein